jgi:uncharacterized protein YutE (UPF0331/DUF86 family)
MTDVIFRKLEELHQVLFDLKKNIGLNKMKMEVAHYEIERQVQLCVDLSVSLARRILLTEGRSIPDNARDSFTELSKIKILSKVLANKLQNSVGLRNIIVHEYDGINYDILFDGLPAGYKVFIQYAEAVTKYLKKQK